MNRINTLVLVGGISQKSLNKRLFNEIVKHDNGEFSFLTFEIENLPYFSQDIEYDRPPVVEEFKVLIRNAQAVLLITPEYNRSFPGVLKNALDWGSRPYGDNSWSGKPTAILGVSTGALGTFGAQNHLRAVCSFLNMHIMSQPEFYGSGPVLMHDNGLTEKSIPFVQNYLASFKKWVNYCDIKD